MSNSLGSAKEADYGRTLGDPPPLRTPSCQFFRPRWSTLNRISPELAPPTQRIPPIVPVLRGLPTLTATSFSTSLARPGLAPDFSANTFCTSRQSSSCWKSDALSTALSSPTLGVSGGDYVGYFAGDQLYRGSSEG